MLETKDLLLRQAVPGDWKSLYVNLWSHDESAKYMLWKPSHSEEEAKERIIKVMNFQKNSPYEYIVCEKLSGQAIGFAGMEKYQDAAYADTGIAIGPEFVRRGYGKQILTGFIRIAFEQLSAEKFVSSCRSGNVASKMLLRTCGFCYSHSEGRIDPRTKQPYRLEFYDFYKKKCE